MEWLADPNAWISLLTLTVLEVVLGIDNIIFISILAGKLPPEQQGKARSVGLSLALITRILLLSMIFMLTKLNGRRTEPSGGMGLHGSRASSPPRRRDADVPWERVRDLDRPCSLSSTRRGGDRV